jgi:two-component system, NtrC family, sensor histidine kinase PilS
MPESPLHAALAFCTTALLPPRVPQTTEARLQALLDPRRIVRWIYLGRLSVAAAIFVAAVFRWESAVRSDTLVASLIFAGAMMFTAASAMYRLPPRAAFGGSPADVTFLYAQTLFDLGLVTGVVHVTGGSASQFAALYILVIACAALLLPKGHGLLIAAIGIVLYYVDALWLHRATYDLGVLLQLAVFGAVALGSGFISARLHELGAGRAHEIAAEFSRYRLQANDILRNIRSGIITVDEEGILLFANPAAGALLGFDATRLGARIGDHLKKVAPELARGLERTITQGVRTSRVEGAITLADRSFPIGLTTTLADGEAGPTATAIFTDISDQKRLEALHVRAGRLEAVAELSASLAHEIKNPLASIRSAVEQLARIAFEDPDARTLSALVVRESDRLDRLLSEFLDFARVRVTKVAPVDIGAVVRGAAGLVARHPDLGEAVDVTCVAPTEPLIVDGDEDLLHRVVFNLALNAAQAVPVRGKVRIEVMAASADAPLLGVAGVVGGADAPAGGDAVLLTVTDDGPGIAPEVRDILFDPFVTTKPGGSGLGLAVVHRAVEAHRGVVFLDTSPRGTRFTVLLPRSQSGEAPPASSGKGAATGSPNTAPRSRARAANGVAAR